MLLLVRVNVSVLIHRLSLRSNANKLLGYLTKDEISCGLAKEMKPLPDTPIGSCVHPPTAADSSVA